VPCVSFVSGDSTRASGPDGSPPRRDISSVGPRERIVDMVRPVRQRGSVNYNCKLY